MKFIQKFQKKVFSKVANRLQMVYNIIKVVKYPTKWVKVVNFHRVFHTVWKSKVSKCVENVQNLTQNTEYNGISTDKNVENLLKTMWKGGEELGRKLFDGYL